MEIVIGLDIGTSGVRIQALDAKTKKIISTAISLHNPLPGSNVVDHLHFAVRAGSKVAHGVITDTINHLLRSLEIDLNAVKRLALCGNPTQMSIFQGIECRDLVFAGDNMLKRLGVKRLNRKSTVMDAGSLDLAINPEAEVFIPPTIEQQIGADALAMLIKSGIMDQKQPCMVTDYGTNAEIGLKVGDIIYTGSCAAGPAIEGGEIEKGVIASPGAISDLHLLENGYWKVQVLDKDMMSHDSFVTNPQTGEVQERLADHFELRGITGTGTIATMAVGFESGLIQRLPPYIKTPDRSLHLNKDLNIVFSEKDYLNSTRCFAAFKAGHVTLVQKSGVSFEDIKSMYLCGASGTYVDAKKAQRMGLALPTVSDIYQVGNTSLAMANDCAVDPEWLDKMQDMADVMKPTYFPFIRDEVFKKAYIIEMDYWEHGLTPEKRAIIANKFKVPNYPEQRTEAKVHKVVARDIADFGPKGLHIMEHTGIVLSKIFEGCTGCKVCEKKCMSNSLKVKENNGQFIINVSSETCTGHACMKCEIECPKKIFRYDDLEYASGKKAW